ncbi:CRISPR-associated protein Cas2 [Dehalococcoides mccartyi]|uniref:CRISPR-associated endoribonuclease Cas2 n=1 Tax=Dehalococcoides mccartyi TaxID=61435 RepID=A0A0V8M5T8_9CHLR|nr:CRISPR-associated endonuclease Cas2 [Dehalococcoides mccartyi]KSV18897.1 CRISPR-associated protein Cas2 [Dehalococcoides mccartyi]
MLVIITYDVSTETPQGQKRLRQVAKICKNFGQRVQKSVFECLLDPLQLANIRSKLQVTINQEEDSLRIYHLGSNWRPRIEHMGINRPYDPEGPLIR